MTLVTNYYRPVVGGIESHVEQLAAKLLERGATVKVVCLARSPTKGALKPGEDVVEGVPVMRVGAIGLGDYIFWTRRLVTAGSGDVLHFHGFSRPLLVRFICDAGRTPWLITPHGGSHNAARDPLKPRRMAKLAFDKSWGRHLLRQAFRVLALTTTEATYLERSLRVDASRIAVVPNALPHGSFEFASPIQGTSNRLLVLSRLVPSKRIDDLLLALRVLPNPPGCDIVGPDQGDLRRLKQLSEGITPGVVRFFGPASGRLKAQLLRDARALVLPSSVEGLSIVALEALAQGTPVIASETAAVGLPHAGLLTFRVGDVEALAKCIDSLNDPYVADSLRERALLARSQIMTDDRQADELLNMYEEAQRSTWR